MLLRTIEGELQRVLGEFRDYRAEGLTPRDISPSLTPGNAIILRPCTCDMRAGSSRIWLPVELAVMMQPGPKHHHEILIGCGLWRTWSIELGWPQDRFRV